MLKSVSKQATYIKAICFDKREKLLAVTNLLSKQHQQQIDDDDYDDDDDDELWPLVVFRWRHSSACLGRFHGTGVSQSCCYPDADAALSLLLSLDLTTATAAAT